MRTALDEFRVNLGYVHNLVSLHVSLKNQVTGAVDLADILRAAFVLGVSALDFYIHEVVRLGMLEAHNGRRPTTQAYLKFTVTLEAVAQERARPTDDGWLDSEIRARHGWLSFQTPERVAKAIAIIHSRPIWKLIAERMALRDGLEVRRRLSLIVDRRNKIAHEADVNPSFPGTKWPIDAPMVQDALTFIQSFGEALFEEVRVP